MLSFLSDRWSTRHNEDDMSLVATKSRESMGMQSQGDYVFWWWQYLWLSFVSMVPYFMEAWQQIFPVKKRMGGVGGGVFCGALGLECLIFFSFVTLLSVGAVDSLGTFLHDTADDSTRM